MHRFLPTLALASVLALVGCDTVTDAAPVAIAATSAEVASAKNSCSPPSVTTSVNSNGYIVVNAHGDTASSWHIFSDGPSATSLFDQLNRTPNSSGDASWTTNRKAYAGNGPKYFRTFGVYTICEGHVNISAVGTTGLIAYESPVLDL